MVNLWEKKTLSRSFQTRIFGSSLSTWTNKAQHYVTSADRRKLSPILNLSSRRADVTPLESIFPLTRDWNNTTQIIRINAHVLLLVFQFHYNLEIYLSEKVVIPNTSYNISWKVVVHKIGGEWNLIIKVKNEGCLVLSLHSCKKGYNL